MQAGDLVRLKQLFIPSHRAYRGYRYALVVNIIWTDDDALTPRVAEILAHLCDSNRTLFYVDESGIQPIYSFYPDEVEPVEES